MLPSETLTQNVTSIGNGRVHDHADVVVGLARRHGATAAVAIQDDLSVLEVRRTRTADPGLAFRSAMRLAIDYSATRIITDVNLPAGGHGIAVQSLSLVDAKRAILPVGATTHAALFAHVLAELPGLSRFVTLLKVDERVAGMERRKTVVLLAAALALSDLAPLLVR